MNKWQHPSTYLSIDDRNLIRSHALAAEQQGLLTKEQLQLIYDRDWFRVMVPKYLGGSEWTLMEVMQLCEAAAWADGSFGWTLNLGAGANMFSAYLNEEIAKPIFGKKEICIAGSDAFSGTAEKNENGFIINGNWRYATGATHAQFFSINCVITENGEPALNDGNEKIIQPFIVPRESVIITGLWNSYGLIATASHDFKIENISIPGNYSFNFAAPYVQATGNLYKFPFLQLAEALLSVTLCGMSIHFNELVEESIKLKLSANTIKSGQLTGQLNKIEATKSTIETSRGIVYQLVSTAWQELSANEKITPDLLNQISNAARDLGKQSRLASEQLYPFAGMKAIVPESEINRTWRDIHTASQHVLLQ
jgi:indole-3-acetate monooxygenase